MLCHTVCKSTRQVSGGAFCLVHQFRHCNVEGLPNTGMIRATHVSLLRNGSSCVLEAEHLHSVGRGAEECNSSILAALGKLLVLAQKAVAWVYGNSPAVPNGLRRNVRQSRLTGRMFARNPSGISLCLNIRLDVFHHQNGECYG